MTRGFSIFIVLAFLAGSVLFAEAQSSVVAKAQRITGDRFTMRFRTPAGANVYAVKEPSVAMIKAIDDGLSDLISAARKNGYRRRLNPSDYTVFIGKPDREKDASGAYSPDIAVGAAQYAGTDFDQGGYIYAAGMVVSNNPLAFVIADHTRNFNRVRDVVRYEGEHLVLYHNDRQRYLQTRDHSQGGGHPILR